jgi:hypothetical protein
LHKKAGAGLPPFWCASKKVQKKHKIHAFSTKIKAFPILFYEKVIEMLFKIVLRFHILHKKLTQVNHPFGDLSKIYKYL